MEKRDRGMLNYNRSQQSDSDWKKSQNRHSIAKRNVYKKHSKHHPRYSSSDSDAKRASYEENPLNWNECMSSLGRKYWFNVRTEKSQWEVPKAILMQRSRDKESTRSKEFSPPLYSGSRKTNSNYSSDYVTPSPRKREDEVDKMNTPDSHANLSTSSSQSLITSLHPLQQALLVKNRLQHSSQPLTTPVSPSPIGSIDSNPISPVEFTQPQPSRPEKRESQLPPVSSSFRTAANRSSSRFDGQLPSISSHLEKFANTPGIRIKKKPILSSSSSSEEAMKLLSASDTVTPIDIVIPECPTELTCDPDLMNLSLIYPFSSQEIEYTEKELNRKMLERLNTSYLEHIESSIILTHTKLRWEINNFHSQVCSLRTKSIASLIEPESQRTHYK